MSLITAVLFEAPCRGQTKFVQLALQCFKRSGSLVIYLIVWFNKGGLAAARLLQHQKQMPDFQRMWGSGLLVDPVQRPLALAAPVRVRLWHRRQHLDDGMASNSQRLVRKPTPIKICLKKKERKAKKKNR